MPNGGRSSSLTLACKTELIPVCSAENPLLLYVSSGMLELFDHVSHSDVFDLHMGSTFSIEMTVSCIPRGLQVLYQVSVES